MLLFIRRTRLAPGHGTAGVDWACSVAARAHDLTGRELQVWGVVGSRVGTIAWAGWCESFDALEKAGDVLEADPGMEKLTTAGVRYLAGGFDDALLEPIHGAAAASDAGYALETVAVAAPGSYARAVSAAIAIAERSEAVTGAPTMLVRSTAGPLGALAWLSGHERADVMERALRARDEDPSWTDLLDSTAGCFVPGPRATRTTIHRRLG